MCDLCSDTGQVRREVPLGHPEFGKLARCSCKAKEDAQRYQEIIGYPMPATPVSTLDVLTTKGRPGTTRMIAAARAFIDHPEGWLTIWGVNGTAKTLTVRTIAANCIENKIATIYVPLEIAVRWLKGGIEHPDFNVEARLEILTNVPLLCLDEVTGARWTDWVATTIESMLDVRYSAGRATVLAMDEDPAERLHPRLVSRIRESIIVHNDDPDFRPAIGSAKERTQP